LLLIKVDQLNLCSLHVKAIIMALFEL